MELKYIVMTIIKILISVPTVLLVSPLLADGAALMGGHLDNKSNSTNITNPFLYDYDFYDSQETFNTTLENSPHNNDTEYMSDYEYEQEKPAKKNIEEDTEEIPNPSRLVLPGYNLPENIFNKGKPFYLEKDPLTGDVDFNSKSSLKLDDEYEYTDDEPSSDIYDKANIDRKDGSIGSHRPSDVNQLVPNFHDFLNLPVKYNSDKYVYPLISSSYANTKIQGNINKYNHKDYTVTTYKPTVSPTYYLTTKAPYYKTSHKNEYLTKYTTKHTVSTPKPTTTTAKVYLTTKDDNNLMNSPMNHPSFEENSYTTKQNNVKDIYLTTANLNNIYLTTKAPVTTTRRELGLFEQLFGEYEETTEVSNLKPPPLFANLPSNKNKYEKQPEKSSTEYYPNFHAGPNVLTGSNMGHENAYEYEDEDYNEQFTGEDNIAVENRPNTEFVQKPVTTYSTPKSTTITQKLETTSKLIQTTKKPVSTTIVHAEVVKPVKEIYTTNYPEKNMKDKKNDYKTTQVFKNEHRTTLQTTVPTSTAKVTSLPLGENHINNVNNKQPIIVATQNLREQLNSEKVTKPFGFDKTVLQPAPSTSNIHIAPDQDTVSFVVGNHQNVEGGQFGETSLKESPYDSNPFRPLYTNQNLNSRDKVSYTIQAHPEINKPVKHFPEIPVSAITIQPLKNSEASLSIGVPVNNNVKPKPGQVVDEKLDINKDIEFPKTTGSKIVFPDEKYSTHTPDLKPPPLNREVLKLDSKPMFHQLPSDLTPPSEKELPPPPTRLNRPRPPWDPRPGHFHSGRPEYARPPRPPPGSEIAYKRIDNLPNILPQFRPNTKPTHHYENPHKSYMRQPLLDRPSNRPIGFFEKLHPPPPPKNLHNLRKIPALENEKKLRPTNIIEERVHHDIRKKPIPDQFPYLHAPPKVIVPKRHNENDKTEVETLQMIQAKAESKKEAATETVEPEIITGTKENNTEKPIYVVYPVNTPPLKLDVIDTNNKESVVIGTRAEKPLPPSKINNDFDYNQNPILHIQDRRDAPILKPHPRPPNYPIKSDFPYPLERPDPSLINSEVSETSSYNNLEAIDRFSEEPEFLSGNQWNSIGHNIKSRVVTGSKINAQNNNQISVTLKTYTEKPIAVAYTPTEPYGNLPYDKFSMPNFGGAVIPEIRQGTVDNAEIVRGKPNNEFTVSAVMHTHPQIDLGMKKHEYVNNKQENFATSDNHRIDTNVDTPVPAQLDFQAPFQASVSIDSSMNKGWSVVRRKNNTSTEPETEASTLLPLATTSEFDIENFKPTLIGGFKPIYSFPENTEKEKEVEVNERQE